MANCFSSQKEHDLAIKFLERAIQVSHLMYLFIGPEGILLKLLHREFIEVVAWEIHWKVRANAFTEIVLSFKSTAFFIKNIHDACIYSLTKLLKFYKFYSFLLIVQSD